MSDCSFGVTSSPFFSTTDEDTTQQQINQPCNQDVGAFRTSARGELALRRLLPSVTTTNFSSATSPYFATAGYSKENAIPQATDTGSALNKSDSYTGQIGAVASRGKLNLGRLLPRHISSVNETSQSQTGMLITILMFVIGLAFGL